MECEFWEPTTEDKAYDKSTDDEKSALSGKSTNGDEQPSDKSTEGEEPSDEKSVVGMKRKIYEEEDDDSEEEDESEESEEETDEEDEEEGNDAEPVADISIDGRYYSNEELLSFMLSRDDERYPYRRTTKFLNKARRYLKSVCESDGFDITDWPGSIWGLTTMAPRQQVIDQRNRYPEGYKYIMFLADKAVKHYNNKCHTNFKVECVDKVNSRLVNGYTYYITFTASGVKANDKPTFQAKVWDNAINGVIEVISCNRKPA